MAWVVNWAGFVKFFFLGEKSYLYIYTYLFFFKLLGGHINLAAAKGVRVVVLLMRISKTLLVNERNFLELNKEAEF